MWKGGWCCTVCFPCLVRYELAHEMRSARGHSIAAKSNTQIHTHTNTSDRRMCLISMLHTTFDRCVSIDHQPGSGEWLLVSRSFTCTSHARETDVHWFLVHPLKLLHTHSCVFCLIRWQQDGILGRDTTIMLTQWGPYSSKLFVPNFWHIVHLKMCMLFIKRMQWCGSCLPLTHATFPYG